jgi:hypothetical protein
MQHDLPPVLILGASGFLGREIARLCVALTHPTLGVDLAPPPKGEPWVQGVQWHTADALDLSAWSQLLTPDTRIIAALGPHTAQLTPVHLLKICQAQRARARVVLASAHLPHTLPALVDADCCALQLPALWGEPDGWPGADLDDPQTWPTHTVAMRRELAAMAALRAALEPQHHGRLNPDQIAYLGDAMMLQGR